MALTEDNVRTWLSPLSEEEFVSIAETIVARAAPRLFAVFQEFGEREEGAIAAWGLAFSDHVDVYAVGGRFSMNSYSLDRAVSPFACPPDVSTRVIWLRPGMDPDEEDDRTPNARCAGRDNAAVVHTDVRDRS